MTESFVGISQGFHDAGITVLDSNGNILFAAHAERYSKIKNDKFLNHEILLDAKQFIDKDHQLNYYERPFLTNLRRLYAGQRWQSLASLRMILNQNNLGHDFNFWNHHLSHAAAAFQTSPYDESAIVIVDAIGEWDTVSIWKARYDKGLARYRKLWSRRYPHSIGLFYTAMTARIGLRPMEDEYVLMGMSAYGSHKLVDAMRDSFISSTKKIKFKDNLHLGVGNWMPAESNEDIAASTQQLTEEMLLNIHLLAKDLSGLSNVCYGGGVALNCKFNSKLSHLWDKCWVFPNPGDCGSSLGAAALGYGRRLNWKDAFLGYEIKGALDIKEVIDELQRNGMVGVANGRAEFGPRSLGNRSLLADPRFTNIKDRVNEIKQRQKYRPFAPAILAEHSKQYFDVKVGFNHEYMQYAVNASRARMYSSICHVDNTARVQTVKRDLSNMRKILDAWYEKTGCPILLNTSLNIRGQPIVNDIDDARQFALKYNVKVVT